MTLAFYTRYALRALARGGQRTLLALLCVTFGVMSLVGMQLLAAGIQSVFGSDPRVFADGDANLTQPALQEFTAAQIAELDRLTGSGAIRSYSLIAWQSARLLKPAGTGQVHILTQTQRGVDPATYPLAGAIPLRAPAGTTFGQAIGTPLGAVVTRALANQLGLHVGDRLTLAGDPASTLPALQVAGIADDVPDHDGETIFYSLDTARRLAGRPLVANQADVVWGAGAPPLAALRSAGWRVQTAEDAAANGRGNAGPVFDFMLKAAGILGLVVGGIGVANTLQVALARRRLEIAMLKTLGYRRSDLLALFGIETALLGLAGGLLGAAIGTVLAAFLTNLLAGSGFFLVPFVVDPGILAGGVLTGALTAVIFGLYTIVQASSVRPATLLRDLPEGRGWRTRLAGVALLLVLVALFTTISSLAMGSLLEGVQVMAGGIAGLIGLMLLLGGTLFVLLRLPAPAIPLLTLARKNLRRQPVRAVFPLIALFMGVFTIGFASGTVLDAVNRVTGAQRPAAGYNLAVYGRQGDAGAIAGALAGAGLADIHASVRVPAAVQTGAGAPLAGIRYLDGRAPADATWDVQVTAGAWTGAPGTALAPAAFAAAPANLHVGDALTVAAAGRPPATLRIAGFYSPREVDSVENFFTGEKAGGADGLLVSAATAAGLATADTPVRYLAAVPPARLGSVEAQVGPALPQTLVVSKADLNTALTSRFADLLSFVVGIAALALLAGAVLIANAVGLALIERRREMGILKAVGFTAGRVLGTFALENALLGLLAGVLGMGAVALAMAAINSLRPAAQLTLDPALAVGMIGVALVLTLGTAGLVAWHPTHVRPLDVLRNE